MCVVAPKYRTLPDAISKRIADGISLDTTEVACSGHDFPLSFVLVLSTEANLEEEASGDVYGGGSSGACSKVSVSSGFGVPLASFS